VSAGVKVEVKLSTKTERGDEIFVFHPETLGKTKAVKSSALRVGRTLPLRKVLGTHFCMGTLWTPGTINAHRKNR